MSFLSFIIVLFLLSAVGIIVWLLWKTVREQAVLRRSLDIVMLQVLLPKDVKADEKEEGVGVYFV